jgi:hypothetical protein
MAVEHKGFLELYNLTNKTAVSKLPLSHLKFLPRVGERVLIPPTGPGDRESYKVLDIEYFLNYDPTEGVETQSEAGEITFYVKPANR